MLLPSDHIEIPPLRSLTTDQKIAQVLAGPLFATSPLDARTPQPIEAFVANHGIGSIQLARGNLEQTRTWVARMQRLAIDASGIPVVFGTDCEVGLPCSFSFGTELPWQMGLGAAGDADLAYRAGLVVGREARPAGIDMVYGPCADVIDDARNAGIMARAYGSDPQAVSLLVARTVEGLQACGVVATPKHFPGHGKALEA